MIQKMSFVRRNWRCIFFLNYSTSSTTCSSKSCSSSDGMCAYGVAFSEMQDANTGKACFQILVFDMDGTISALKQAQRKRTLEELSIQSVMWKTLLDTLEYLACTCIFLKSRKHRTTGTSIEKKREHLSKDRVREPRKTQWCSLHLRLIYRSLTVNFKNN